MPAPGQYVADCWQSAEFFVNKVLLEHRNSDSRQVDWAKALKVPHASGPWCLQSRLHLAVHACVPFA
jgi:hypothetical protein